jgi:hypothetical protein
MPLLLTPTHSHKRTTPKSPQEGQVNPKPHFGVHATGQRHDCRFPGVPRHRLGQAAFALALISVVGTAAAQTQVDPFAMQLLHSRIEQGFAELDRGSYQAAKVRLASAFQDAKRHGALGSSALAGVARASLALGEPVAAITNATQAINLAQFKSASHLALAFEVRGHARAVVGDMKGALLDYMQVISLEPGTAPARYQAALTRCSVPPGADLRSRIDFGLATKCPLDPSSIPPALLARSYPGFVVRVAAEKAEAQKQADVARQAEERRRAAQAAVVGDPSAVPYMHGSTDAGSGKANIGFCNKSSYELRIAIVRKKGKFGGLMGRTWTADGYYSLAPSTCTHRSFGYAEDFTDGYVSVYSKRGIGWVALGSKGDDQSDVGGAAWQSHKRSICWPTSAEGVDPDADCPGSNRNLLFTHWFATSGHVPRLTVTIDDYKFNVKSVTQR